ncbi:hypothetical protein [Flavisericum labens]|uniref:hypothetical protein n=1 Tax=Flavisericum labens TaxID=3377112 RepID=UPI00387B0384
MKHLFVINNPISDLVSEKLIKSEPEKFNKENTIVCTYRGYKSNLLDKSYELPVIKKKPLFILTWVELTKVRRFLNSINDDFTVYLPTTGFEIFQIIINHTNCLSYCYLEEGLASYYTVTEKNKFHSDFINRHSSFGLKSIRQIYHHLNFGNLVSSYSDFFDVTNSKYKASYCFSNHCFGEHPNKQLLKISFNKNESLENIKDVLVLESLVEVGLLKREVYLAALERLIKYFISNNKNAIYYKFHPDQNKSIVSRKTILKLFKKFEQNDEIKFFEIDSSLKLEDIAFNSFNSEFYMIVSSVAIYANLCGRQTYSFYKQVLNLDAQLSFKNYIKTIPSEYFNIVNSIDEN